MKTVGVADGNYNLANAQSLGIAESDSVKIGGIHADDRKISRGIISDKARGEAAGIRESDLNPSRAMHHVAVGENEAVRSEHKAGASAPPLL